MRVAECGAMRVAFVDARRTPRRASRVATRASPARASAPARTRASRVARGVDVDKRASRRFVFPRQE